MVRGMNRRFRRTSPVALALGLTVALASPAVFAGQRDKAPPAAPLLPAESTGPVTILVSTDRQRLTVYDGDTQVAQTVVSTGVADHPTPHGVFSVIEKQVFHRSNLYSDAPMPFMQRLTWSGIAMHEGHVTGRPASHGCVRLPMAFAKELFRYTKRGARVVIAREDVSLGRTDALDQLTNPGARTFVMGEQADAGRFAGEVAPPDAGISVERARPRRDIVSASPVTVLISRKSGRLYVRRAFAPVMEVPVTIDNPEKPLGAHLFVAHQAQQPGAVAWSTASVAGRMREAMLADRAGAKADTPAAMALEPSASEALQRIHLAPGTAARLRAMMSNGAALIISDDGARGRESWTGTNFIALAE